MKTSIWITGIILVQLMLSGCFPFGIGVPPTPILLHDLLINVSVYPSGWTQESIEKNAYNTGEDIENISIGFRFSSPDDNISNQYIWRFVSPGVARREFDALLKHDRSTQPGLIESKELFYSSPIAQRTIVRCDRTLRTAPLCSVMAQYGSFITEFTAYIDDRSMSQTEFSHIVSEIDKNMAPIANK